LGEFARSLRVALADGRVSGAEFGAIRRDAYEVVTALLTLVDRLEGMVRD
jgi:hypothetical protein